MRSWFITFNVTLAMDYLGTSQTSFWWFFRVFFQDLCEFVIHCNKRHIFLCLFVFLLTITGRYEAIIVELKELFVLNGTFITCSGGSHH